MEEKIYLTSDQYVVKLLGEREKEIAKLIEKYDDLLKRFVVLQTENKKFEELKARFKVEKTIGGQGWAISFDKCAFMYNWSLTEIDRDFQEALDFLGLKLPKE